MWEMTLTVSLIVSGHDSFISSSLSSDSLFVKRISNSKALDTGITCYPSSSCLNRVNKLKCHFDITFVCFSLVQITSGLDFREERNLIICCFAVTIFLLRELAFKDRRGCLGLLAHPVASGEVETSRKMSSSKYFVMMGN